MKNVTAPTFSAELHGAIQTFAFENPAMSFGIAALVLMGICWFLKELI